MILVLTPLEREFKILGKNLKAVWGKGENISPGGLTAVNWRKPGVVLGRGGRGKAEFAARSRYYLDRLPGVEALFCVGAAGALDPELRPGSLIAATYTVEYDFRSTFAATRGNPRFPGAAELLKHLENLEAEFPDISLHRGIIASGDRDVVNREQAEKLRHRTGARAVAWEGAGGARAARLTHLPFLELRAVTDLADRETPADFRKHLDSAFANLSRVLAGLLSPGGRPEPRD